MAHIRRYTRPTLTILALLFAGAVINVLVACACTRWGDQWPKRWQTGPTPIGHLPAAAGAYINDAAWVAGYTNRANGCEETWSYSIPVTRVDYTRWFDSPIMGYSRTHSLIRFGLPLRSMELAEQAYEREAAYPGIGIWRVSGAAGGWPLVMPHEQRTDLGAPQFVYPLVPIPLGFVANTLFYALLLCTFLLIPRHLRRRSRRRRGLCRKCAYPIGASPVCTECGAPISSAAPATSGSSHL